MKATVQKVQIPAERRVLVVGDVHAVIPAFEGLLKKVGFSEDDTLILLGDMLEKGPDSLKFLRYLMEFVKTRDNVYFVRGNCDNLFWELVHDEGMSPPVFWSYLSHHPESLLWQLGAEAGYTPSGQEDLPELAAVLERNFAAELQFIDQWPTILETETMVFVHGGVPSCQGMESLDAWRCMKNDNFLEQDVSLSKLCVVGHTPVTLYSGKMPSSAPIIDLERRIISIDGGCGINPDGQLNALIFSAGSEAFAWMSYDGLPTVVAQEAQSPSEDSVNVRWGENRLELLEAGEEFSRCRQVASGRTLDILTDYLYRRDGELYCEDATDYELEVVPGDWLSVVRDTTRGLLVKKDGVTGWFRGSAEPS